MEGILTGVEPSAKRRLDENLARIEDAGTRIRYLIVINLLNHRSPTEIARVLGGRGGRTGRSSRGER